MGQNETTRNWTAGFGPCFHLPGFHFGYICLTHTQMERPRFGFPAPTWCALTNHPSGLLHSGIPRTGSFLQPGLGHSLPIAARNGELWARASPEGDRLFRTFGRRPVGGEVQKDTQLFNNYFQNPHHESADSFLERRGE